MSEAIPDYLEESIALVELAYNTVQEKEAGERLYIAYSGGKDSDCIAHICIDTLPVEGYELNYNATGIDPPELVRHIKRKFGTWRERGIMCNFNPPKARMHDLIVAKGPPTITSRYCCEYFKENASVGRVTVTGVRWAESYRRKHNHAKLTKMAKNPAYRGKYNDDNEIEREILEHCTTKSRITINPIVHWTDKQVWEYIRGEGIEYCALYDEGFTRLGCIGCPMAGTKGRQRAFKRWPHMYRYYQRAMQAWIDARPEVMERYGWNTLDDVWHWWMRDGIVSGQTEMELDI